MWTSEVFLKELDEHGYSDLDTALAAIGERHLSARTLVQKVAIEFRTGNQEEQMSTSQVVSPRGFRRARSAAGIHVEGLDDVLVRLSRCCTPVPGDEIMGFVTRGRGVSVHRSDCANAVSLMSDQASRLIEVEWAGDNRKTVFRAGVEVVALDRSRLLRDVANALSEQHVNIVACSTHTGNDRVAKMRFEFELADPGHLDSVLRTIKGVDGVYDAYRLVPGKNS